jgi:hypothetical protein
MGDGDILGSDALYPSDKEIGFVFFQARSQDCEKRL